jgi:response regulator RpfG family c-di-GMP phosphodiesterase
MTQLILLVDDEPKVISALTREITSQQFCEVISATSGNEALELLRSKPSVSVIVSDYRMPVMDGITFLLKAQEITPDATRMILSGVADLEMATNAINLGQIFRLLLKPCPTETFISSIKDGIRQYELVTGERELLQKTLKGSIKILTDLLSAINPDSFLQSTRISALSRNLANELGLSNAWEVELAGALCRIGCVTIPPEVLDQWMKGKILDPNQQRMVDSVARISNHLLQNIPRLEKIAEGILYQSAPYTQKNIFAKEKSGKDIPLIGRILKIVIDYDRFYSIDHQNKSAFNRMQNLAQEYDPEYLTIFKEKVVSDLENGVSQKVKSESKLTEVNFDEVQNGMTIMANVFDTKAAC